MSPKEFLIMKIFSKLKSENLPMYIIFSKNVHLFLIFMEYRVLL